MRRVYVKEEVCMGCKLCDVYCHLQHSQYSDLIKAYKREAVKPVARLRLEESGPVSFSLRCQHCDDAPCTYACLTGALSRDAASGTVSLDEAKCIGCWTCVMVCPFGAIKQDSLNSKAVKCDLCQGKDIPVCVANCPNEALVYVEVPDESPRVSTATTSTRGAFSSD